MVKESFLKARSSVEHTVNVVQQANVHLEQWITTWSAWASTQEESSGRYIISSFSVMLHSGRFFANTLSLRDITSSEQLLPIHLPLLRTALDAAVRIQGAPISSFISFTRGLISRPRSQAFTEPRRLPTRRR